MALSHEVAAQFSWIIWIFTLLLNEAVSKRSHLVYMTDIEDCDGYQLVGGAVVYSHRGAADAINYGNNIQCRITFNARNEGSRLMMRVVDLDIPDRSFNLVCNDALYVYDGGRVFDPTVPQAGGAGGLCGNQLPPVIYSSRESLTLYFRTDPGGRSGRGFKLVITAFNDDYQRYASCREGWFLCANKRCIDGELTCDSIDHCGDFSDELDAGTSQCGPGEGLLERFLSLGITAAIAITVGTVVVVVVLVVCIVCCCCRCAKKANHDPGGPATHQTTTTTATSVTINNGGPPLLDEGSASQHEPNSVVDTGDGVPPNGHSPFHQPYTQQGYYPMQPVQPHPHSMTYSPFANRDTFSQHSAFSPAPPSYHRSYTPTSSKSGRSHHSSDGFVKYNHDREKVALPVHL